MGSVLYLADRNHPRFDLLHSGVDVVCAGDSLTGWNNFGGVECWPYPTYPEALGVLCESAGLTVANCGIAGRRAPTGSIESGAIWPCFPTPDISSWGMARTTSISGRRST